MEVKFTNYIACFLTSLEEFDVALIAALNAMLHVVGLRLMHSVIAAWGGLSRHPGWRKLGHVTGSESVVRLHSEPVPRSHAAKGSTHHWLAEQYSEATKHQQPMQPIAVELLEMCCDTLCYR